VIRMMRDNGTTSSDNTLRELHAGLSGRAMPESVVTRIIELLGERLSADDRKALPWRGTSRYGGYSLMANEFEAVSSLARATNVLAELIGAASLSETEGRDPAAVRAVLSVARDELHLSEGLTDFKRDRANRAARAGRGLELSRRRYNKLFRIVSRLEGYASELDEQLRLFNLGRFAKTSYAAELTYDQFATDVDSACFVAYYAANLARRSLFTNGPQARAFDDVAAMLLRRCEANANTNWYAIAHVFPRADVLSHLTAAQQVELLDRTLANLHAAADVLEVTALRGGINLKAMVVHKGNDSSTWNAVAGAWNRARDYWIALVYSLGQESLFESFLPGKVLRLMAGDVAFWHASTGGDLHDDTPVWVELPKPWDVMAGRAHCTKAMVVAACEKAGINPDTSAWAAPRPRTAVEAWRPTPESVHGVVVNHPELALFLRKIGVFSGKSLKLAQLSPAGA